MINIYKWVVKHRTFVLYPLAIIECASVMSAMISADISRGPVLLACAWILLFNNCAVNFCFAKVINEIISQRNGGDRSYAIALSDELLAGKQPPHIRATFIINKSIFLSDMGQYSIALDMLFGIDVNELPPALTFVLYNNISDAYSVMGNLEKAEEYHLLAMEHFDMMPKGKLKEQYSSTVPISKADIHILKGEYHAAIELAESIPPKNRDHAYHLTMARALVGLGNTDEAREHYNKVVESGYSNTEVERLSRIL